MTLIIKKGGETGCQCKLDHFNKVMRKTLECRNSKKPAAIIYYTGLGSTIKCLWDKFPINILFPIYVSIVKNLEELLKFQPCNLLIQRTSRTQCFLQLSAVCAELALLVRSLARRKPDAPDVPRNQQACILLGYLGPPDCKRCLARISSASIPVNTVYTLTAMGLI